jgi:hypothetical protein
MSRYRCLLALFCLHIGSSQASPSVKVERSQRSTESEWVLKIDQQEFPIECIGGTPQITKVQKGQHPSNFDWILMEYDGGQAGTKSIVDLDRLVAFVKPTKAASWVQRFDVPIRIQRSQPGRETLSWNRSVSFSDKTLQVEMDRFDEFNPVSLALLDLKAPQVFQWMQRWTEEGAL